MVQIVRPRRLVIEDHPIDPAGTEVISEEWLGDKIVYGWIDAGPRAEQYLIDHLLAELGQSEGVTAFFTHERRLVIEKNAWGQPQLLLNRKPGPAVSFSRAGQRLYGALAGRGRVGCDCAQEEDFIRNYPLTRVFHQRELDLTAAWAEEASSAAALIWSLKEAAVKALGTGFNLFDPLEVEVEALYPHSELLLAEIRVDRKIHGLVKQVDVGWFALAAIQ